MDAAVSRTKKIAVRFRFGHIANGMASVSITINDLFEFEGKTAPAERPDNSAIEAMVQRQFNFLPQPLQISVTDNDVSIVFTDEASQAKEEAVRLAVKAGRRAAEGNFGKAITTLKRALELQPSLLPARRDLAMAYSASGDVDSAKNHLIEVLRLDPKDQKAWVTLANLYIRHHKDLETGERFLHRALDLSANDPWTLNSLGGVLLERGRPQEAAEMFRRTIEADSRFANAYFGLAMIHLRNSEPKLVSSTLAEMFACAKAQDARSLQVFSNARDLFADVQPILANAQHDEAAQSVERLRQDMERQSGYPVRIVQEDFENKITGWLQVAWKAGRDHHLLRLRKSYPDHLQPHMIAHELLHLQLEVEARQARKNRFLISTAKSKETAIRRMAGDIVKLEKLGYSGQSITDMVSTVIRGLAEFLLNCPLDMIIETRIRQTMPVLHAAQFLSLRLMANEAWETNTNDRSVELTPRLASKTSFALNGANALFVDDLYHGATCYASRYQRLETFELSKKLFQHWKARFAKLEQGEEYTLVDEFASMLGVRDFFEWKDDPNNIVAEDTATPPDSANN